MTGFPQISHRFHTVLALWVTFQLQLCLNPCSLPINDEYERRISAFEPGGFIPPISLTNLLRETIERSQIAQWNIFKTTEAFQESQIPASLTAKASHSHQSRQRLSPTSLAVRQFRVFNAKYPNTLLKPPPSNQSICGKVRGGVSTQLNTVTRENHDQAASL